MTELNKLLAPLHALLDSTTFKQLSLVIMALLSMQGRITILGISRWTGKGGSYRTLQRFFKKTIPWEKLNRLIVKSHVSDPDDVIIIAGDITVVTKAGKNTFGLGKFFSNLYTRAIPGIAFQTLSLVSVKARKAWPIILEQVLPKEESETPAPQPLKKTALKRGRPKGSKNKNRRDVPLNAELTQIQGMLQRLLEQFQGIVPLAYFAYDGAYGHNAALQMTRMVGLHLISKLRRNSALYFEWDGEYSGRGRRPIYGAKIDYKQLPSRYLKATEVEGDYRVCSYHIQARHKRFPDALNVVIQVKTHQKTGKQSHVILFSSDLRLAWDNLVEYYRLRFQIEFNFRDAKQHWGLEDFMVTDKIGVHNSAHLALLMVNVSQALLKDSGDQGVIDLKARYHSLRYLEEILKILPETAKTILIKPLFEQFPILGAIHNQKVAA